MHKFEVIILYKSINIKNRILAAIADRGLNKTTFLKNAGLPETTLRNMDNSFPSVEKIAIIANHLECSVDYLLGRQVSTPELSENENILLSFFRECSENSQKILLDLAEHYSKQDASAREKEKISV
jgi:lambda repressor-like predicted transcriptional regulator